MGDWDVTTASSAFKFQDTEANYFSVAMVDANHAVVAYLGAPYGTSSRPQGQVQVLTIDTSTWAVTTSSALKEVVRNDSSNYPGGAAIIQVDDYRFLCVLGSGESDRDQKAISILINSSTYAVTTTSSEVTVIQYGGQSAYSTITAMDANHFLFISSGAGADGYARAVSVNTSTWAVTAHDTQKEFDTSNCEFPSVQALSDVDDTHAVCQWESSFSNNKAETLAVNTSTWAVTTAGAVKTLSTNVSDAYNATAMIDANHILGIFGEISSSRVYAQVLTVNTSTWAITTTISNFQIDDNGYYHTLTYLSEGHYLHTNLDTAVVLEVNTSTYAVSTAADPLTGLSFTRGAACAIDDSHVLVVYISGVDGYAQVLAIDNPDAGGAPEDLNISPSDSSTLSESVSVDGIPNPSASDSTTLSEDILVDGIPNFSVSDTATLSEAVSVTVSEPVVSVSDTATLSEDVSYELIPRSKFKTQIYSDDFNRGDDSTLGADWSQLYNNGAISSNQATSSTTGTAWCVWATPLPCDDQYVRITYVDFEGSAQPWTGDGDIILRKLNTTAETKSFYMIRWQERDGDYGATVYLYYAGGGSTIIEHIVNGSLSDGDIVEGRCFTNDDGNVEIEVYVNDVLYGSTIDDSADKLLTGKYAGIGLSYNDKLYDDFETGCYYGDPQLSTSDTITVTDIFHPENLPTSIDDSVTVSETVSLDVTIDTIAVEDTATSSESVEAMIVSNVVASETVTLSESVNLTRIGQLDVSDTVTISESTDIDISYSISVEDTVNVSEVVNNEYTLPLRLYEVIQVLDQSFLVVTDRLVDADETVTTSENVDIAYTSNPYPTDTTNVSESVTVAIEATEVSASESATLSESVSLYRELPIKSLSFTDTATLSESFISIAIAEADAVVIPVIDTITVTESKTITLPFGNVSVTDTITVTDTPTAVTPTVHYVDASESITVTDTFSPSYIDLIDPPEYHEVSVSEIIHLEEDWVVDRDIWGAKTDEDSDWQGQDDQTSTYTEISDPSTDWTEAGTDYEQ